MAMMSKTRDILEGLVREGSFKWALSRRTSFNSDDESEDTAGRRKWISELSPIANVIVGRCSRILEVSMDDLQHNFNMEASESLKNPSNYARNFLEYCCFRALSLSVHVMGHLSDKNFRRLTFDMMLAWEAPSASSQPALKVEKESTVGLEAFSRIAPAIPTIADVVTCSNVFDILTHATGCRLTFTVYDKYIGGLDRAAKKMKTQTESSLLSALRSGRGERILEVDGTLTTQPVLEHIGISAWPGRLTLTDHAFYFEALRVVTYDKAKVYELADDLKQILKPELTGPWGSRLFDKAVMYKSTSISEPVTMEFPELGGHKRRDYWLAIMREVLYAHRFIRKFQINRLEKEETLSKAVLGILRLQAIQDLGSSIPLRFEELLMFNLCNQLPGGDIILEALADTTATRKLDRSNHSHSRSGMHSPSASAILSSLGFSSQVASDGKLLVGDIVVGEITPLERAVKESKSSYKMMEHAQSTIDGIKADGIEINLAVMQELMHPLNMLGKNLLSLAYWEDPLKSILLCCVASYIILRGWLAYLPVAMLLFAAIFMLLSRFLNRGREIDQIKVKAPPPMNPMEQLLALQDVISKLQEFVQDTNIILLKLRALLLAAPTKVADKTMVVLIGVALIVAFLPSRFLHLLVFLEIFTMYSPPRRASTDRLIRRLKEWWFSIPAAPVLIERDEEKKKK